MDKYNKPKLNITEQINSYMKSKGILFNISNKQDAINFLTDNSYLFKLKSYAKNYEKRADGTYINLEFAYLQELSTIDMHLRRFCMRLALDIEHMLKTKLLRDFNTDNCDGYSIVDEYLRQNTNLKIYLENYNARGYTAKDNILKKYGINLSIWNFLEILEFGNFLEFCKFYYTKYPNTQYDKIKNLLWSVKYIRNLSAHNNCLINNLNPIKKFRQNFQIQNIIQNNINSSTNSINQKMKIPIVNDIIATLIIFKTLCKSKKMQKETFKELIKLFNGRLKKHEIYFDKNTKISSVYVFLVKVILFLKKELITL